MSNEHEDKVYDFFTQRDNFETMLSVMGHYNMVVNRLNKEFWDELINYLVLELKNREGNWVVEYSDNFDVKVNKVWMYREEWKKDSNVPLIAVAYESIHVDHSPYVGIFINRKNEKFDTLNIFNELRNMEDLSTYKADNNPWWARWKFIEDKILKQEELEKLLSDKRQITIENVAQEALDILDVIDTKTNSLIDSSLK